MRVSERELILAAITAAVLLVGLTFVLGKPVLNQWKAIGVEIDDQKALLEKDEALIDSRGQWEERFVKLGELMPSFPAQKKMDIHWLTLMDQMANKNGLVITKRQVGEEKRIGDVYEMTIDVKEWEGGLDALVKFLFDLQSIGVMLDITQLYIKPLDAVKLRGRFTLNCAFSREEAAN